MSDNVVVLLAPRAQTNKSFSWTMHIKIVMILKLNVNIKSIF
jgi:hypothetical protein